MIRRLVAAADMLVDAAAPETVGRLGRQQNVIDANAVILLPGAGLKPARPPALEPVKSWVQGCRFPCRFPSCSLLPLEKTR